MNTIWIEFAGDHIRFWTGDFARAERESKEGRKLQAFRTVPDGFAILPKEPDYNMLRRAEAVGVEVNGEGEEGEYIVGGQLDHESAREVWKEMVAAAPKVAAAPVAAEVTR